MVATALSTANATNSEGLTSAGMSLGTPAYMSPEQATADPLVDHRADIYAWGMLAYELLTGKSPFAGRSPSAMVAAQVTEARENIAQRAAPCRHLLQACQYRSQLRPFRENTQPERVTVSAFLETLERALAPGMQLVARLQHPHIVPVFSTGTAGDLLDTLAEDSPSRVFPPRRAQR